MVSENPVLKRPVKPSDVTLTDYVGSKWKFEWRGVKHTYTLVDVRRSKVKLKEHPDDEHSISMTLADFEKKCRLITSTKPEPS